MKRVPLVAIGMLFGALAAYYVTSPAVARDDAEDKAKLAEEHAKLVEKYETDKKGSLFIDYSHWLDKEALSDSRWAITKHPSWTADKGVQLLGEWSTPNSEGWQIQVVIVKMIHKEKVNGQNTEYSMPFNNIGESCKTSETKKLNEYQYADWIAAASDVIEKQCTKPTKRKKGPAKFYSSATGTDPEDKERIRIDWYYWNSPNVTWKAQVKFRAAVLDMEDVIDKGEDFIKAIDDI